MIFKPEDILKKFEGCRLEAYKDTGGIATIGYGATYYMDNKKVQLGDKITQKEADDLLAFHIAHFEKGVKELVKAPINQNQLSALISFSFNLGLFNLKKSGLLKLLNQGKYNDAADQFLLWNKIGLYISPGLTSRRTQERTIFLTSVQ